MKDSARPYESKELLHFSIITEADCIDVIAMSEPKVEYLAELYRSPPAKA